MKRLLIAALAAFTGALSQTPSSDRFDMAVREDFFAGFRGDQALLDRGMKKCEEALAKDPKMPAALVWHGGGLYFRSGQAFRDGDIAKGIELSRRGQSEMNEAVALAPDDVQTRIPRGAVLLAGAIYADESRVKPLVETAIADYEKAMELEGPALAQRSVHSRGELMGGLADAYRRLGDAKRARAMLVRLVKELPGTAYEKQASRWLNNLSAVPKQERFCLGCHVEPAKNSGDK